jgi:hypothetical protein
MILIYTFPFLDANDFDEGGDKDSLQVFGNIGESAFVCQRRGQAPRVRSKELEGRRKKFTGRCLLIN